MLEFSDIILIGRHNRNKLNKEMDKFLANNKSLNNPNKHRKSKTL